MLYTLKKCKYCGKITKKLYYHTNRKDIKKWIPIVYYCSNCKRFNGNAEGKNELRYNYVNNDYDDRFNGGIHCKTRTLKLYEIKRINGKQKWIPRFYYCNRCKKIICKIKEE
jgi:hypothetical protein